MGVRLQRNISGAAASTFTGLFQSQGLSVFDVIVEIKTFAGDFASYVDDNGTDQWTGAYLTDALRRKFQRPSHHLAIYFSRMCQEFEVSTICVSRWIHGHL